MCAPRSCPTQLSVSRCQSAAPEIRACDLVKLRVRDVCHAGGMASRAIVLQQKTQRPVQFEITEPTRDAVGAWISHAGLTAEDPLFPSRIRGSAHLSTRQYARIVDSDPALAN